jgi:hypothetical protein
MPAPAFGPEPGGLDQQFSQHQALAQVLQAQQHLSAIAWHGQLFAGGKTHGAAQHGIALHLAAPPSHLAEGTGQHASLPLHPRRLPAQLSQICDLPLEQDWIP